MTIPKFRVWDKVKAKMYSVEVISFINNKVYPVYTDTSHRYVPFNESVLMQSTGLVDKNGKEIFEGDIVLIYGEKISKVFYSQGSFCVDILNGGTPLHGFSSKQLEVIGNIYENPELLEEEK